PRFSQETGRACAGTLVPYQAAFASWERASELRLRQKAKVADGRGVGRDGPFGTAIGDTGLERSERRRGRQGVLLAIEDGDMHEAHAIVETERRILQAFWIISGKLGEDFTDEAFVLV